MFNARSFLFLPERLLNAGSNRYGVSGVIASAILITLTYRTLKYLNLLLHSNTITVTKMLQTCLNKIKEILSNGNMSTPIMKIEMEAYGVADKVVKPLTASSGRVYVPASWIGKKVRVVLLEEPIENGED